MDFSIFAYVAILLLVALLSTRLVRILKLPNVTGYIVTGIIMDLLSLAYYLTISLMMALKRALSINTSIVSIGSRQSLLALLPLVLVLLLKKPR